jgi:hypothetical protein
MALTTMRVQGKQASLARAQAPRVRVNRRRCVVVDASKKSVGDLTEADLKGKAVFVRAGEVDCGVVRRLRGTPGQCVARWPR